MIGYTPLHAWEGKEAVLAGGVERLRKVLAKSDKAWAKNFPVQAAFDIVAAFARGDTPVPHVQATVLADSHLLLWGLAEPWYYPGQKWLVEEFFIRVGAGCHKDALKSLDLLAENVGATGIVMATALARSDLALGRLLAQQGYSPMNSQHFKPIGGP
jgi:hypothetical protein